MSIYQNLISRPKDELLGLCEFFDVQPLKTPAGIVRQLEQKMCEPDSFKMIVDELTDNELDMLLYFAEGASPFNYIFDNTAECFPVLTQYGYLPYNASRKEITVPLAAINLYIQVELENAIPLIDEPTFFEQVEEYDRKAEEQAAKGRRDEVRRSVARQLKWLEKDTLLDCLMSYRNEELKDVCRFYGIKGFSSKKKEALAHLIDDHFFNDFRMLEMMFTDMTPDVIELVMTIVLLDRKYLLEQPDLRPEWFCYLLGDTGLFIMTEDVKAHIKKYAAEQGIGNVAEMRLFYRRLLNLYGYVDYLHLQKMSELLLDRKVSLAQLKKEMNALFTDEEVIFSDKGVKHIDWYRIDMNMIERPPYYEPSLDELERFLDNSYISRKNTLKAVLQGHAGDASDFEVQEVDREIRKSLRECIEIDGVLDYIAQIIEDGLFNESLMLALKEPMLDLMKQARLWSLAGNRMVQQRPKGKVMKRSKKRKQNMNVARVVKLDDYRG